MCSAIVLSLSGFAWRSPVLFFPSHFVYGSLLLRFVCVFFFVLIGLFTLELLDSVHSGLIIPFTNGLAWLSASLISPFDDAVIFYDKILQDTASGFAVSIEAGCNGVEATIVLIAAVVAFPAPWRYRLAAIGIGFLAVQSMNIARIISLFYVGQWNLDVFTWVHLYLWPVLIMLDVLVVFLLYLRFLNTRAVSRQPVP